MSRHRVAAFLAIAIIAVASAGLLRSAHVVLTRDFHSVVTSADNLNRMRLHVNRAYLAAARIDAGDPTFGSYQVRSELASARAVARDWMAGRDSLLGLASAPPTDPAILGGLEELLVALDGFEEAIEGTAPQDPVAVRVAWSSFYSAGLDLEFAVYAHASSRVSAAETRHQRTLLAWGGFLLLGGLSSLLLMRERLVADARRIRAERRRDHAEARYAKLRSLSPVGLLRVNREGKVLECNRWWCGETGIPEDEWTMQVWWSALGEEERIRVTGLWERKVGTGRSFEFEVMFEDPQGRSRWLLTQWTPSGNGAAEGEHPLDEEGGSGPWMGTIIDISERHGLQRQLNQAQKLEAIGNLTGGIAHDFNNLLTVILSNVAFLRLEAGSDEAREMLHDIEAAASGGAGLIRSLLGFGREGSLQIELLELEGAVEESVKLGRHLLPTGVELELHLPDEPVHVLGDPVALQQIVLNLISNARDAIEGAGRITVEVARSSLGEEYVEDHPWFEPGAYGQVVVSDTGCGMDEETVARIFDPFFTTKAKGKGTGLGLATLHNLVRQLGGHVHVYSEPGQGSVFRVYIPEAEAVERPPEASQPEVELSPAPPASENGRKRVLVVDDDPILRRTALRLLSRLDFHAHVVEGGAEALQLIDSGEEFDVILSDVSMDGVSGIDLLEHLRARAWPGRFVLTSGYTVREVRSLVGGPDRVAFLPKPWTVAEIEAVLNGTEA